MEPKIAIGVDVGGSHIVSAAVDLEALQILPGSTYSASVHNKAPKETVFATWSKALNQTMAHMPEGETVSLGFAIPGPFDYTNGIALYTGDNDKYAQLYGVSLPEELSQYLDRDKLAFRFLNDATSFGVGVAAQKNARDFNRIIVVTLGTGFGSAFVQQGIPLVNHPDVPKEGCLWDKPFKEGIGDDYFSTRWCIQRYQQLSSETVPGVREIAMANNEHSRSVFTEFGTHMAEFMLPFLQRFRPDVLVLGGNISKAHALFLPALCDGVQKMGLQLRFEISPLMEDAAIIGSARLFEPHFWNQVKDDLPTI
ncbi:MAG: ROK family protein [Bacteroidota bacterium]